MTYSSSPRSRDFSLFGQKLSDMNPFWRCVCDTGKARDGLSI